MPRILKTAKTTSKNAKGSTKPSPSKAQPKAVSKTKVSKPAAKTVSKPVALDKKRCQRCSKWNPVEDSICNWCDKPVSKAVKPSKPAPVALKRQCDHCGKFNPTADAECNWCEKPTRKPAAPARDRSKFQKGSGQYQCIGCGKQTRSTGRGDNENARLCETCYDRAGDENAVTDGDMTQKEFDKKWGKPKAEKKPAGKAKPTGFIVGDRTGGDLYFDTLTETMRVGPPPARGGQHGASPRVTDAEADRLFAARQMDKAFPADDFNSDGVPAGAKTINPVLDRTRPAPSKLKTFTNEPRLATTAPVTVAQATAPHTIIIARAGTGKTTTLIGGTQKAQGMMPCDAKGRLMVPSEQQAAVWATLALSKGARNIGLTSFSNTIVDELKERVRGTTVAAFTLHSYGFAAVRRAFRGVVLDKSGGLYKFMLADMLGRPLDKELYKEKGGVIEAVNQLVKQCKMNLCEPTAENLDALASHFDIEINQRDRAEVYNYVPAILDKCKAAKPGCRISFDDMIWLPVVLKLPVDRFDLLMVDEAQDLNRCQQALARMAVGDIGRLVFCGDPRQAIFGFAGADNESMDRMQRELGATARGVEVLKLTKTRRCGKAIVDVARQIVPDFEAFESNPTGVVSQMRFAEGEGNFRQHCRNRDMVLCRTNAPLVSQCFKFLREGKTAIMLGRAIGEKLAKLVTDFEAVSVVDLIQKMETWLAKEREKEEARRIPNENKLINLQDNFDCLMSFTEGAGTVEDILKKIDVLFTDDRKADAIRLASIHKSKGLEADRVFFINTEKAPCPHPMAKSAWSQEQEMNLLYVGTTRAISELVQVA